MIKKNISLGDGTKYEFDIAESLSELNDFIKAKGHGTNMYLPCLTKFSDIYKYLKKDPDSEFGEHAREKVGNRNGLDFCTIMIDVKYLDADFVLQYQPWLWGSIVYKNTNSTGDHYLLFMFNED